MNVLLLRQIRKLKKQLKELKTDYTDFKDYVYYIEDKLNDLFNDFIILGDR